jgi:hypothetical protein
LNTSWERKSLTWILNHIETSPGIRNSNISNIKSHYILEWIENFGFVEDGLSYLDVDELKIQEKSTSSLISESENSNTNNIKLTILIHIAFLIKETKVKGLIDKGLVKLLGQYRILKDMICFLTMKINKIYIPKLLRYMKKRMLKDRICFLKKIRYIFLNHW